MKPQSAVVCACPLVRAFGVLCYLFATCRSPAAGQRAEFTAKREKAAPRPGGHVRFFSGRAAVESLFQRRVTCRPVVVSGLARHHTRQRKWFFFLGHRHASPTICLLQRPLPPVHFAADLLRHLPRLRTTQ